MVLSLAALWAAQVRQNLVSSIVKGLKIVTDSVTNVANIASLATKNSGSVAMMSTMFLCVDDQ